MKNLATTKISVLDLAKVTEGQDFKAAFENSKITAQHAEKLGYTRFWLAEHHNIEGVASAATSVLIGYVAENTKTIRVGSGGIMLPNHSPLVIAEQFGTLASLYPDRIDLGLGRAPGTDQATMKAIRGEKAPPAEFSVLIDELQHYFAPAEPGQKVRAIPGQGIDMPLYILGSSLYSAQLAAMLGRPYSFAGHFAPAMLGRALDIYRSMFKPSKYLSKPYVIIGVPVIGAETDAKAEFISSSLKLAFLNMVRGQRRLGQPPVEDIDSIWTPQEKQFVFSMLGLLVTGGKEKVRAGLDKLIADTNADELMITSDTYNFADRLKSLEVIAAAKAL